MTQTLIRPPTVSGIDRGRLAGYALTFLTKSHPIRSGSTAGDFTEWIAPGALDLADRAGYDGVVVLHNHDVDQPLGSVNSGTLTLNRDHIGLRFGLAVNDAAPLSGYVYQQVRSGQGTGMSFGFRAVRDRWTLDTQGNPVRTVEQMQLFEVSVLTQPHQPAYPATVLLALVPESQRSSYLALATALQLGSAA